MSLSHFDERSGIVAAETPWGKWWQTVGEIFVEINIPPGTPGKDCKIDIKPNYIECRIRDKEIFKVTHTFSLLPTQLKPQDTINYNSYRFNLNSNDYLTRMLMWFNCITFLLKLCYITDA